MKKQGWESLGNLSKVTQILKFKPVSKASSFSFALGQLVHSSRHLVYPIIIAVTLNILCSIC